MSDALQSLFENPSSPDDVKKKSGPENRINDLNYSDWMKYQKSFFRWEDVEDFVDKSILFFSKELRDGNPSRVLVLGFPEWSKSSGLGGRVISHLADASEIEGLYDHAVVDFRNLASVSEKSIDDLEEIFQIGSRIVSSLHEKAYAQSLFGENSGFDYPIAWEFAQKIGSVSRLRDERVALHNTGRVSYAPIFQKDSELEHSADYDLEIQFSNSTAPIPGWIIPKPPPRRKNEKLHPAKYPETLVETFIECFTAEGDTVFDPMSGTGSTQVAALNLGRKAIGFELSEDFAAIANQRIETMFSAALFGNSVEQGTDLVLTRDATEASSYEDIAELDYVCTSPPYWSMLRNPGSENQRARRDKNLQTYYSDSQRDLGNIEDYDLFVDVLVDLYKLIGDSMRVGAELTIVVKNVKRNHTVFPLAWDLAKRLSFSGTGFGYAGNSLWCQDDVGLKPFAIGTHWVSNTLHQYCLHFIRI